MVRRFRFGETIASGVSKIMHKNKNTRISGRKIASAFGGSQGTVFGPYNFRLYHHQNYRFANP
jgi:hypothetical protein